MGPISDHETPATLALRDHWADVGISKGWETRQAERLCRMLQCSIYELGMLAGLDFATTTRYLRGGVFPPTVALHFKMFEDFYLTFVLGRPCPPAVPMELVMQR